MPDNIVPFPRQKPEIVSGKQVFSVTVDGIEKVVHIDSGKSFGRIVDYNGMTIMMYPVSRYPDKFVSRMIMSWRSGYEAGRSDAARAAKTKDGAQ
ncbi:hypothetical protein [Bradyrhizobium diazoefficiens]|uniref:hypothetical protein n=1 Tax=Bradyrhizobium diazoefficiens TaxID=1355477 RepID=UPI0012FE96BA|nr:hypothetical protein [Bradyrhizobium diazoefficiens]